MKAFKTKELEKRKLFLLILLLFAQYGFSQIQEIPFEIGSGKKQCTLIVDKKSNLYKFTLQDKEAVSKKDFQMQTLSLDNFIYLFKGNITTIVPTILATEASAKAIELYSILVNNNEKGPLTGKLFISKRVSIYNFQDKKIGELVINSVGCVVQQGFIQDVNVIGQITNLAHNLNAYEKCTMSFTNIYGIGFTSKKNYPDLSNNRLFLSINFGKDYGNKYPDNLSTPKNNLRKKTLLYRLGLKKSLTTVKNKVLLYVLLGDVIKFDRTPGLYTNDFSPADIAENWKAGEEVPLYKEPTFKLFEGRIFTDFAGFNSDNPNGLIQVEVEKKANFNTKRYTFIHPYFRSGIGFSEYIRPYGGYSKVEDNNKYLTPNIDGYTNTLVSTTHTIINPDSDPQVVSDTYTYHKDINGKSTTPIDLLKHQSWRLGLDINVVSIDIPSFKSQFYIDGGATYASSAVRDSIKTFIKDNYTVITGGSGDTPNPTLADLDLASNIKTVAGKIYSINYWQFYGKATWRYAAEYRYGIDLSYSPKYFYMTSDKLDLIGVKNKSDGTTTPRKNISKWTNEFELLGFWRLDANGKIFIRWRLNSEMGYVSNYYNQIQLGYAFNVLGNK